MKRLLVLLALFALHALVAAAAPAKPDSSEGDLDEKSNVRPKNVVFVKTYTAPKVGTFHAILRKDGHQQNLPYLFELRSTCGGLKKNWQKLDSDTVVSACKVVPNSFSYNPEAKEVSIMAYDVDWADYQKRQKAAYPDIGKVQPECKKTPEKFKLSLTDLCRSKE